jgi:hypothetical protein
MSFTPNSIHRTNALKILRNSQKLFVRGDGCQKPGSGFAFYDLLGILGVLSLLFLLQISTFAHNKGNSHRAVCAGNLHRLGISWLMYADDNRGRLVPNSGSFSSTNDWVTGVLDYSGTASTNPVKITQGKLYPYNKAVEIYRCPDDLSTVRSQLRVRSYSMNGYVGDGTLVWSPGFQRMINSSQIRQPDRTFVFIEEHPDSINDGFFVVDMSSGSAARIVDFPASYHYYGVNQGFADGSVQYRAWLDSRTSPTRLNFGMLSPNNADLAWLQGVSTYRN